jgi:hypothetical protein
MASAMYDQARQLASGRLDLEVSYATIAFTTVFAIVYTVVSYVGMKTYEVCSEMQDKKIQKSLDKYLRYTIAAAITMPLTLLATKLFNKEAGAFAIIYGLMGGIGSAAALNWSLKCPEANKTSKYVSGGSLAIYAIALIYGLMQVKPRKTISNL